jgi:hypothetical protein
MSKTVVVLNGYPRSGKDTFAEFCKAMSKHPVYILSTVDKIKEAFTALGWDGSKTDENREFLHELKMLWTRKLDGSFKSILKRVENIEIMNEGRHSIVFVMAREPEEIARFKEHFGNECVTLFVERAGLHIPDNAADREVENYEYEYRVKNPNAPDWATELRIKALGFLATKCYPKISSAD